MTGEPAQTKGRGNDPVVSVVVPIYNEEGNIVKLVEELSEVFTAPKISWEIVFIDDGSKDGSWEKINALHNKDSPNKRGYV